MEHKSQIPTTHEESAVVSVHDFNPTCISINPNLTIIFFHNIAPGKDDNWKETWTSQSQAYGKEELVCWPEKWLPEDLGENVRILSVSCDATFHTDLMEIGKNILQSLMSSYENLWEAPIVLVGHSFGGLMLKSLVVEVFKRMYQKSMTSLDVEVRDNCEKFLENVKGMVFYSVPHGGGSQEFSSFFASQCLQTNVMNKNIEHGSKNLNSFNRQMEQLDADFTHSTDQNLYNIFAFSGGLHINDTQGIIVPFASSIRLSSNNHYKIEDANHLTICKPPNKDHPSYYLLLRCLQICLKKSRLLPRLPTFEVDLESHAMNVIKLLEKVPIIGLVGMGGIGKTVLGKKVYDLIHNQYEKSSFLEAVGSKNVKDVLKQLLHDLCGKKWHNNEDVDEDNFQLIRQCLITKKALVVIDDVRAVENLVALQVFVVISKIESKSKIIVTCRNWEILKAHVSEDGKVDMALLNDVQAKELFMFHAFGGASYVPESFEEISNKVVAACAGLPLSLQIMGSFLNGTRNMEIWKEALNKLLSSTFKTSEDHLNSCLRISYDNLPKKEKDMFLDISCFFCNDFFVEKGLRITTAIQIWDQVGLLNLKDKALINTTENGIITMHQLLQNLGRQIAWDEKRNRSWDPKETLRLFSHQNEVDINSLEGMSLLGCEEMPSLLHKNNMKFPNLRLLDMRKTSSNVVKVCIRKKRFKKLKWISLQASNIQKLPNDLANYSQLHVLDLAGCQYLEQLPNFIGSKLVQLQEFDLSGCSKLENFPDGIGGMLNLQHLLMKDCVKLQKLPTSIGEMSNLRKFDLSGCLNVQKLPTSIGSLSALCELNLSKCSKLQELPTSIGQLNVLEYLNISWCKGLQELPTTIGDLHALQKFDLSNCFKIQKLPTSIGKLINLQDFNLSRCFALHELPVSIGQLIALQKFDLSDCSNLLELPTSVGELNALKEFNLSRCFKLQKLFSSIGKLIVLQEFNLSKCSKLKSLPNGIVGMLSLQHLLVKDCVKLQNLPTSIGEMSNLHKFDLSGCLNVQELPNSIGWLNALSELNLSKCEGLQELPNTIGDLHVLQKFDLSNCFKIQELPISIGKLINLQDFNLSRCSALRELPSSIGQLIVLQKFDLSECSKLLELPSSIGQLTALQKLNFSGCSKLQKLPTSIGQLLSLQELNLLRCSQLQKLPTSIGHLIALQKFDVSGCVGLQVLPTSIGLLSYLQELNFLGCSQLQELPISICQLDLLKELNLSYCSTLRKLPNDPMGKLNALQCLDLFGCFGLKKLPAITIGQLNTLQELDMYGCSGLQKLPKSIKQLIVLKKLNLHGCIRLQNLPTSIGQLCALQIFNLSNCIVLKELPTSIGQLSLLQEFDLSRCFKLVDLPISIGELNSLRIFNLSECYMLKELPSSIGQLTNLEEFNLSKCYGLKELPSSIIELITSRELNLVGWSNWQDRISRRRQETQQTLGTMIQSIEYPSNRSPTTLQSHFPERKGMERIVFMGKRATKGDSHVEFLYPDAKDMARVVGIGMNRAKVVVTNHFDVKVIEVEDEDIWTNLWNSENFVPMAIFLPDSPTEKERIAQSNLTLENPSKRSGVGLTGNDGIVRMEGNNTLQGDQCPSPLILDIAEHMGLIRENLMSTSMVVFEAGSTSGSIDDGRSLGRELQRRRSPGAFKSFVQPRKIYIKDYESSEENEGDTTFLVEDPLDSPPSSSSLGAKVSKDIVGIGRQSRIINLGRRSGRSIDYNAIKGHDKTSRSSYLIRGQSTKNNGGETSGLPQDERKVSEDDCKPYVLTSDNLIDDPPFSVQEEGKKVLNVTVYPRGAGIFFNKFTQNFDIPKDHLKNAIISAILEFKFELEGKHGKTITTTTKTKCSFGEDNYNPSYYQNIIKISLKCEEAKNPPRLTKDEVDKLEPIKKTVVVTSNTSNSLLDGGSATLGLTILGNQLGGNLTHTHTIGTGLSHTQSIETIVDQLDGFEVSRQSQESKMIYRFNYPRQSLDHAIAQFHDTGFPKICNTFEPSIIGEWHVSETDVNKCAMYRFEVERSFFSIEDLMQSRKDGTSNLQSIPQQYEVRLEVNHAMSHIHNYQTSQLLEGAGVQDLPNVIKAHPAN